MAIPIIMIHWGYASHLLYTLAQAKATNPRSSIVLLGDAENSSINFVTHRNASDYFKEADKFEQLYRDQHASPNNYRYELLCFQRWFVLKEFMEKHQLDRVMHIDSDLMLYADMTEEAKKFEAYEFTIHNSGCGHNSFISLAGIRKFCNLLWDTYSDPSLFAVIQDQQKEREAQCKDKSILEIGGISDMSLLRQFHQINADYIGSTSTVLEDSVYDLRIDSASGHFEMQNGLKKIHWINHQPFCKNLTSNQLIRFNSLHFQGGSKRLIRQYFTGNRFQVLYHKIKIKLLWQLKLIQQ